MLRSLSNTLFCLVAAAVFGTASAAAQDTAAQDSYQINGGDLLHISVYGEQNLDRDVPVHGVIEPFAQMVQTIKAKPAIPAAS